MQHQRLNVRPDIVDHFVDVRQLVAFGIDRIEVRVADELHLRRISDSMRIDDHPGINRRQVGISPERVRRDRAAEPPFWLNRSVQLSTPAACTIAVERRRIGVAGVELRQIMLRLLRRSCCRCGVARFWMNRPFGAANVNVHGVVVELFDLDQARRLT